MGCFACYFKWNILNKTCFLGEYCFKFLSECIIIIIILLCPQCSFKVFCKSQFFDFIVCHDRLDRQVIRTQVIGIGCKWWLMTVKAVAAWLLWHYPLLQGWLLTPSSGSGGDQGLWVRYNSDDMGSYRPGPPRNVPLVHIPPSWPGTWAGHPAIASPWCSWSGRLMVGLGFLEEEARRVPGVLKMKERRV